MAMAGLTLAASVLLSLFLLSSAHPIGVHSDLLPEADAVSSATTEPNDPAAIRLPSDRPSSRGVESLPIPVPAVDSSIPTVDAVRAIPIEVSLIPIRGDFPHPRPFWRRLGRHCHHLHRGPRGGDLRGAVIPYGDDMVVPAEQHPWGHHGGRVFSGVADHGRLHPMVLEEVSVEELAKQGEMGFPREMRPFPRFRPGRDGEEGERGLVKRFLDLLNRH